MNMPTRERCFGCGKIIEEGDPRIHAGLDEALDSLGSEVSGLGLDDVLRFAFCDDCTERGGPFRVEFETEDKPD